MVDVEAQRRDLGLVPVAAPPAAPMGAHRGRISAPPGAVRTLLTRLPAGVRTRAELGVGTVLVAADAPDDWLASRAVAHEFGGWMLREAGGPPGDDGFGLPVTAPVVSAAGKVLFSDIPLPQRGRADDIESQEYFSIHRDRGSSGLYVSVPIKDHFAPGYWLYLSKTVLGADGKFLGVVVAMVSPPDLVRLNQRIQLGGQGALLIVGVDSIVRARSGREDPTGTLGLGKSLRGDPWPEQVPPGGYGDYTRVGLISPVTRLLNYRRLDQYPLIVLVGVDMTDLLKEPNKVTMVLCAVGGGLTALII